MLALRKRSGTPLSSQRGPIISWEKTAYPESSDVKVGEEGSRRAASIEAADAEERCCRLLTPTWECQRGQPQDVRKGCGAGNGAEAVGAGTVKTRNWSTGESGAFPGQTIGDL